MSKAIPVRRTTAFLAAWLAALPAAAFELGGAKLELKSRLSAGGAWRTAGRDPALVHPNNGAAHGIVGGTGGNTDDAELNFEKGRPFTAPVNLTSRLSLEKGGFGAVAGMRAWKDFQLAEHGVSHGSFATGYRAGAPLDDRGYEARAKFSNAVLTEAYAREDFETGAGRLRVTAGRHVLRWGEAIFIRGLDRINPHDFNAGFTPGLESADARLPQAMISAKLSSDAGRSLEAFFQLEHQGHVFPGCGTYFLPGDGTVGPGAEQACAAGFVQATAAAGDAGGVAARQYIPAGPTREPGKLAQFGVAAHFEVGERKTDVGVYAMRIHSRQPYLSAVKGNSPFVATTPQLGASGVQTSVYWEYPQDVDVFGVSAKTKAGAWTFTGELGWSPNQPVQVAAGDLLGGLIYMSNPAILSALLQSQGIPAGVANAMAARMNARPGPLAERIGMAGLGDDIRGYDRIHKVQLQLGAAGPLPGVAGAKLSILAAEAGAQWASVPDNTDGVRYGRSFVFGLANSPAFDVGSYGSIPGGAAATQGLNCPLLNVSGQSGCANAGFVTPLSGGARLRAQLVYPQVWGTAVTLKPTLFGVPFEEGYAADGQFNAGRRSATLSLLAEIGASWTAQASWTKYDRSARWDPLRDRDQLSLSAAVTF